MQQYQYNYVIVIESLKGEEKTGTFLYNDIIRPRMMQKNLESNAKLYTPETKADFSVVIEEISNLIIDEAAYPMIHFETHGSKEGIKLSSGEFVNWSEMYKLLIKLNIQSKNNVFISMATCFGGYIFKTIVSEQKSRSPFWGFIGAFEEVNSHEIMHQYSEFYNAFLLTDDFQAAIKAMKYQNPDLDDKFIIYNTEMLFEKAYKNYEDKFLLPEVIESRCDEIVEKAKLNPDCKDLSNEEIKAYAKYIIVEQNEKIKTEMKNYFFLRDIYPELNIQ